MSECFLPFMTEDKKNVRMLLTFYEKLKIELF